MSEENAKASPSFKRHFLDVDIVLSACAACHAVVAFANSVDELSEAELKHDCNAAHAWFKAIA